MVLNAYLHLLLSRSPRTHTHRYSPYSIPSAAAAAANAAAGVNPLTSVSANQAAQGQPQQVPHPTSVAGATVATQGAPQQTSQQAAAAAQMAAAGLTNPYQGYSLANVDMSSFQGVDWGSLYGMGMYV